MSELIDFADFEDNILGTNTREYIHAKRLPHRVIHVICLDKGGKIILGKRAPHKKASPNCWGNVAGHIDSGESPLETAKREIYEEFGLRNELRFLTKLNVFLGGDNEISYIYTTKVLDKKKIKLIDEEFTQVKAFSKKEILSGKYPIASHTKWILEYYFSKNKKYIQTSAPGKIFLAGEIAVLETGNPSLVAAVNKRVEIKLSKSEQFRINAPDIQIQSAGFRIIDNQVIFRRNVIHEKLNILKSAIEVANFYIGGLQPFVITTKSNETLIKQGRTYKKLGFGSSAAITVGTIGAILKLHNFYVSPIILFKLSVIAHFLAQGKVGSGFDVAASVYGGFLHYNRFDPDRVSKLQPSKESIRQIVHTDWNELVIEKLQNPEKFYVLPIWTGESVSTSNIINKLYEHRSASKKNKLEYDKLTNTIAQTLKKLIANWKDNKFTEVILRFKDNSNLLLEIEKLTKVKLHNQINLKVLEVMKLPNTAAKMTGGGGDIAIIVTIDKKSLNDILKFVIDQKLNIIDIKIEPEGFSFKKQSFRKSPSKNHFKW